MVDIAAGSRNSATHRTVGSSGQTFQSLPIALDQPAQGRSATPRRLLLLAAMAALMAPAGLIAAFADEPGRAASAVGPAVVAQVGIGLVIATGLLLLPLYGVVARLAGRRRIDIDRAHVRIVDSGLLSARTLSTPLDGYRGIAHVVRSTLDGTHHELVLAHDDPRRSVVLASQPVIGPETIEAAVSLLGRPEIPAHDLFRLHLGLGLGTRRPSPAALAPDELGQTA